jgi:hypothetical protein
MQTNKAGIYLICEKYASCSKQGKNSQWILIWRESYGVIDERFLFGLKV